MAKGTVKWFDPNKHYGFITPDEGQKDLFVHEANIETQSKALDNGQRVEFELGEGRKGTEAINVRPLTE